ncbi:MAG TPA: hypothetical protein ENI86_12010 [Acidimicrobiales bacterium]|nr:hypothetical protein [Acidimicrobiales bacterium]
MPLSDLQRPGGATGPSPLNYLTALVALCAVALFLLAGTLDAPAEAVSTTGEPTTTTGVPTTATADLSTDPTTSVPDVAPPTGDGLADPGASSGDTSTSTRPPETTTVVAPPTTASGPGDTTPPAPTTTTAPIPTTTAPAPAPTTTAPSLPPVPTPPASRFVADSGTTALIATSGGDDPVATALTVLDQSGPLGRALAADPRVRSRLESILAGKFISGPNDFTRRILQGVDAALSDIASDEADVPTGLCLVTGASGTSYTCAQVPDLSHSFSSQLVNGQARNQVSAYIDPTSQARFDTLVDLATSGSYWGLLRDTHSAGLTSELRNAWIRAGSDLVVNEDEAAVQLTVMRFYLEAARDLYPQTWDLLRNDGGSMTGTALAWNTVVSSWYTTSDQVWNLAFADGTDVVSQFTGGAAGSTTPAP